MLYKEIYVLGAKIPKRDKFGIYLKIEQSCLESLRYAIRATYSTKDRKILLLPELKVEIETTKHLIRLLHELNVIEQPKYLQLQTSLQEISRMTTGWQKYLTQSTQKGA